MVFSALAEAATLGIVIPFVMVLVEPERVFQIGPVEWLARLLNVDRAEDFVVPLALLFVFGILVAMAIRVTVLWAATRVSMAAGSDLIRKSGLLDSNLRVTSGRLWLLGVLRRQI